MGNPYFITRGKCPCCSSGKVENIFGIPFDKPPISNYLKNFYAAQGKIEFHYLKGANYSLTECQDCGLIFQKEIPNDELMERLYEQWIDSQKVFDQNLKQHDLNYYSYYAQEIMQIIAYLDQVPSSLSFFDFGMGWGKWALMAKAFGCNSYGAEFSKQRINYATANGINLVTWDEIPQCRFDFINTEQVFEHISDPLGFLLHLKRGLKSNGILKISVPTANDMKRRLKKMDWEAKKGSRNSLNPVAPLEHINCFRRASLVKMANIAGMEEVLIPLKLQYKFTTNWAGITKITKNIVLPVYRNILKKQNYLFFRKVS